MTPVSPAVSRGLSPAQRETERTVFTMELAPGHRLRVAVFGEVDEEALDALAQYVERRRKQLAGREMAQQLAGREGEHV